MDKSENRFYREKDLSPATPALSNITDEDVRAYVTSLRAAGTPWAIGCASALTALWSDRCLLSEKIAMGGPQEMRAVTAPGAKNTADTYRDPAVPPTPDKVGKDILTDQHALELATNVRQAILKGEAVHEIAVERLACYIIGRSANAAPATFFGPCSCADSGKCKHTEMGPLCMQESGPSPTTDIDGLRKRVTAAEDVLMALVALNIQKTDQAWQMARRLLRTVRPAELAAIEGIFNGK